MKIKAFYFVLLLLPLLFLKHADFSPLKIRYNGDKVFRLLPSTKQQQKWIYELFIKADANAYDFWTNPRGNLPVDVHVSKRFVENFFAELENEKINYTVTVPDVQRLIDNVDAISFHRRRGREINVSTRNKTQRNIVGKFAYYDEIIVYLETMCSTYSKLAKCGLVGKSWQGRDLRYIKIGAKSPTGRQKEEIFIEAGIHAREWLAPATAIFIINKILTNYEDDGTIKRLLNRFDFVFVPLINPDGYEHSRIERLWRKTRSKHSQLPCIGVDANRNYDIFWGTSGSSDFPCSNIYHGPAPFSESETKAMSNFLLARKNRTLAFFTLHTYSQLFLVPYGDRRDNYPLNFHEMLRVATIGTKALMAVNNMTWESGNTVDVLGPAAGGGDDWAASIGIKYSYTLELRPDRGTFLGFIVAESEIEPSAREIWAGLVAAIDAMQSDLTIDSDISSSSALLLLSNSTQNETAPYSPFFGLITGKPAIFIYFFLSALEVLSGVFF